jgi:hypothetical protein
MKPRFVATPITQFEMAGARSLPSTRRRANLWIWSTLSDPFHAKSMEDKEWYEAEKERILNGDDEPPEEVPS